MVGGHPFKMQMHGINAGQLAHPDMKRFQIHTPFLFTPPHPTKSAYAGAVEAPKVPSFGSFFSAYFGGATYKMSDNKCGKTMENMKKCYETSTKREQDPVATCAFYIDGFKRMACAN